MLARRCSPLAAAAVLPCAAAPAAAATHRFTVATCDHRRGAWPAPVRVGTSRDRFALGAA